MFKWVLLGALLALCHGCLDIEELPPSMKYFGYSAKNGPSTWQAVADYCKGSKQSPINLEKCKSAPSSLAPLQFRGHWDFRPDGFLLENTWHAALVKWTGEKPTLRGGPLTAEYTLAQIHFHWGEELEGSEHSYDGKFYAMEAHLVHYRTEYGSVSEAINHDDGLAVVGIMLELEEEDNDGLANIVAGLPRVGKGGSVTSLPGDSMLWLEHFLEHPGSYYTYSGSLTTPPCSEVVTWINMRRHSEVSEEQVAQFRTLLGHEGFIVENVRPIQPLNSRTITCVH